MKSLPIRWLLLALWLACGAVHAEDDPCRSVDPRAYLMAGVCKIPNISAGECRRIGGQNAVPVGGVGTMNCAILVPQRGTTASSGSGRPAPGAGAPAGSNAANTVGALGNFLGALGNFQNAWNGVFGRNPERDGDLLAGGMAPLSARALDAIGMQALRAGIALEEQALADAAADSYARAAEAAQRAGDPALLKMVGERQLALECRNAIGTILSTGQNPEDRYAQYQALRGSCGQSSLTPVLDALIAIERDRLPPGPTTATAAGAQPAAKGDLARRLRKLLEERDNARDDAEAPAAIPASASAPGAAAAPSPAVDVQPSAEDGALARATTQQQSRRRIFCSQTSDPQGCLSNDNFCLGAYAANRTRLDDCTRAFHDPNIWYDAMGRFWMDPAETRAGVDALLKGAFERQLK